MALHPDGKHLFAGGADFVRKWETTTLQEVDTDADTLNGVTQLDRVPCEGNYHHAAFTPF